MPESLAVCKKLGVARYRLTFSAGLVKVSSNWVLAHYKEAPSPESQVSHIKHDCGREVRT